MEKGTQEVREKNRKKMKAHQTAVLQSHAMGEIAVCPGCNSEMTLKMIKYVWNS